MEHSRQLRTKVQKLVPMITQERQDTQRHSNAVRFLGERFWKRRLVGGQRIIYSWQDDGGPGLITFWEVLSHEEGEGAHGGYSRPSGEDFAEFDAPEPTGAPVGCEAWEPAYKMLTDEALERLHGLDFGLPWLLDEQQLDLLGARGPIVLTGHAGTGKSTVASYRLANQQGPGQRLAFVTYTQQLRDQAKKQHGEMGDNRHGVAFLTFTELARNLVPDAAQRFPVDAEVGFPWFSQLRIFRSHRLDPIEAWEEIRGVIRGDGRLLQSGRRLADCQGLSEREYLETLPSGRSLFSSQRDARLILEIFRKYQEQKKAEGVWDDLDLTLAASFEIVSQPCPVYDQVVCDEVQDLTVSQLGLLARLVKSPDGFLAAGDADQAIHPSRFEWARMQDQLYDLWGQERGRSVKPKRLSLNYRSTAGIVTLSNRICQMRSHQLGTPFHPNEALREGLPPAFVSECALTELVKGQRRLSPNVLVVTPDEKTRDAISAHLGQGRCMTVHEAKGLESPIVIAYGFLNIPERDWQSLMQDQTALEVDWTNPRLNYCLNALNVAVTRARDHLFVADKHQPSGPIFRGILTEADAALLPDLLCATASAEDFLASGRLLEESRHYKQAAANYRDAGRDLDAYRCEGLHNQALGNYRQAALDLTRAEAWPLADKAWQTALRSNPGLIGEAIETMLHPHRQDLDFGALERSLTEERLRPYLPADLAFRLISLWDRAKLQDRITLVRILTPIISRRRQTTIHRILGSASRCIALLPPSPAVSLAMHKNGEMRRG